MSAQARPTELARAGFALPELLVVLALAAVIVGVGLKNYSGQDGAVKSDADMRVVYWQLKLAREVAINQRRSVEVVFEAPNAITLVRHDLPTGTSVVSTTVLEHQTSFRLFRGLPDTPDGFGNANAINFGAAHQVMFTPDGLLVDEVGNPVNASIFLGQENQPTSARAITVFAPTAAIRTYRWTGSAWMH